MQICTIEPKRPTYIIQQSVAKLKIPVILYYFKNKCCNFCDIQVIWKNNDLLAVCVLYMHSIISR